MSGAGEAFILFGIGMLAVFAVIIALRLLSRKKKKLQLQMEDRMLSQGQRSEQFY